jgi:hypothetical protein
VGRQVTLPAGTPPTGPPADEALLATLIGLGDLAVADRHCELTVATVAAGELRRYHLSGGQWIPDAAADPPRTTLEVREGAGGPLTFTCATLGSGQRLGGNRDEDPVLDGDDCSPADASTWGEPATVGGLKVRLQNGLTRVVWNSQSAATGPSISYDVLGADVSDLAAVGLGATSCLVEGLQVTAYNDPRPNPPAGDGYYYLVRAHNPCGVGDVAPGDVLETLECSLP